MAKDIKLNPGVSTVSSFYESISWSQPALPYMHVLEPYGEKLFPSGLSPIGLKFLEDA